MVSETYKDYTIIRTSALVTLSGSDSRTSQQTADRGELQVFISGIGRVSAHYFVGTILCECFKTPTGLAPRGTRDEQDAHGMTVALSRSERRIT